ncbi:class II glutamine amidotransferase [Aquabacterium soli]|jgi:predicted glutamine amidotransferase|uniref:Class II glutamine amidotransferase n=1 Tax=Aquabacterium soli TaxID=2493092 RepID=A0A3R8TAD9_9BURK|nr:class II glutamine amidotransferase [Aquabacterium soli]RRS03151.1 class II glutamine amidotransferase [Aquabacterium soli]
MCELLGMNCNVPTDIVFSFSGFSKRASEHADGFGIAFFENRGVRCFVDAQAADQSPVADLIRQYPIRSTHVIAHIRKATVGHVALENCHPFTRELWGRYWVFAHNGDLKGYDPLLHAAFRPVGDTDSERAFCWLLQEMAKSHASVPTPEELTRTLRELVPQVARFGTFNFIMSNGQALWAHCSTKLHHLVRQHPFAQARLQDDDVTVDFAQVTGPQDRVALVATQPLTDNEDWQAFKPGELLAFVDGVSLD